MEHGIGALDQGRNRVGVANISDIELEEIAAVQCGNVLPTTGRQVVEGEHAVAGSNQ